MPAASYWLAAAVYAALGVCVCVFVAAFRPWRPRREEDWLL